MEHLEPIEDTKEVASSVYNVSLDSIQMALGLTVALAWYAFIKNGISTVWPSYDRGKLWALGAYAVLMTLIFAIVLVVIKNVLKVKISNRPVVFALTQGM